MITDALATINNRRSTLVDLPSASEATFPGFYPWSPISTSALTNHLRIDKGLFGTWRNRGLTPEPLPSIWFKAAAGNPRFFRVDAVRDWLARRTGERYDALGDWRRCLCEEFGADPASMASAVAMRRHAAMFARAAGPRLGDVTFTGSGFEAYVASLTPGGA